MNRDLLVARIISGTTRLHVSAIDKTYIVKMPSRVQRYVAQEVYEQVLQDSQRQLLFDDAELLAWMLEEGLWDETRQSLLDKLPKEMEEFKVQLFENQFRSNERDVIRKALAIARQKWSTLAEERYQYGFLSCVGAATLARARYILGCSLYHESGLPVFTDSDFWESETDLLDQVSLVYTQSKLPESTFRILARTDPWRSIWNCRKFGPLFDVSPIDLTDEQRTLVNWSLMYDNIFENPECPPDEVIEDDDVLDGWLILQRRKRVKEQGAKQIPGGDKIGQSDEVYLVADTVEDARKVEQLNDTHASAVKKQRFKQMRDKGVVNELEFADVQQRLRMEFNQKESQTIKERR